MSDYFELLSAETYEDYLKLVNVEVHQNISMCQNIAKEYQKLKIASEKEKHESQIKLNESAKPYYERRKAIIMGAPLTDEEIQGYQANNECPANESSEYQNGVPCFWLHVLKNSGIFDGLSGNEEDSIILTYLQDINADYFSTEDCTLKDGTPTLLFKYNVNFLFGNNPYLRNNQITIQITYKLGDIEGEFEEPKINTITPLDWVKGKDPRFKITRKKTNKKGRNQQETKVESFFDLFYPQELALNNDINDDGLIDEEALPIHDMFQALLTLINEVIPAAVNYFDETLLNDEGEDLDEDDDAYDEKPIKQIIDGKPSQDDSNTQPAPQECTQQ
ncbi:nucleosome assembly protein, putative [Entamoeba histolytica HM-1:IMSS-B]|uniref:Nucleosome assembly protein, putative n=6 Tax=Entamoeba histolytica TaxID=5759 RepID=C4M4Y2_ENTH1|nr:nucleosome assembly protein, putative [Entamoeba histolytica HM-1:IMSS]EMD49148.1 nucleosome assembly protein, putative [Entamoeba histolytica KU27]EMH73919.1 nucleosome assembly protein, putative [Entamoeba histolytica HM-1:IMSS-B]EMS15499.1 nucleosome assembly protein, putative [Entamoeba histolytica HM-3:IMSS]ENY62778.1 nucleosome assembly protein, putative [Entamoeba histolytica HM-1:IMSS-A]GAT96450.1 nucleosome assembly protein putative [Entamoeba histolytica]|eukprot:XP_650261.2 nucleosome assembly protein, putative [Entamoeba histolytica HM-1:IMSS]